MTRTTAAARAAALGLLAAGGAGGCPDAWKETGLPTVGERAARARAQARPARPADPDGARARMASFVPEDPLARPHAALVRSLAAAAGPVDAADAAELLTALAGHAAWLAATGADVDADALLDPDLVQRWVLLGLAGLSAGTAANYRSRLARVAAQVHGAGRRPALLHASDPASVYSERDEDDLLSWGTGMRTPALRRDVLVLLCLGLGAGLTTAETVAARGAHVDQRASDRHSAAPVATVTVEGARPRLVPVRARYGPLLLALASDAGSAPLFRPSAPQRGGRNAVSNLVARARRGGDPRLPPVSPQRMRATWIVRHLDAGVRADALLAAAGLDSLAVLDRYLPTLRPLAPADVVAELTRARP